MNRPREQAYADCIVIDPGHGGGDTRGKSTPFGVRGPAGTLEKDVALELGRRVVAALGSRAVLTRSSDRNLSLAARSEVARRLGARTFVSIHANSGPRSRRGAELFVHPQSGPQSTELAQSIASSLDRVARFGGAPGNVVRGELGVLEPARLPPGAAACLVEVDYLSDPDGERRLRDPRALDAIAGAIADGCRRIGRRDQDEGLGWTDWVTDPGITAAFETVVSTNIAVATEIAVPAEHERKLRAYAAAAPADAPRLLAGLSRRPTFYQGGWILDVQTRASAMTLDEAVFVRESLSVSTYIHELVHVAQYGELGRPGFLEAYFGLAALEILRRLIDRQPIDTMTASPYETEAYDIESRFRAWATANGESL